MKNPNKSRAVAFRLLTVVAMALLVVVYFAPIWWVSLKAPNYPPDTFPQGVRIHFHITGVQNGCEIRASQEVQEDEALDCVHEMNTINHYIGMAPIEDGGKIEIMLAPYAFGLLGLMLAAFMVYRGRFWWVLPLGAVGLPVGFVADYSAWLWYFGHSLHPWGAFTVKPFMPTVFGEGKVAQFSTYSYPHWGFGVMLAISALLLFAMLLRWRQLQAEERSSFASPKFVRN